jgi:hypothetical protein
MPRSAPAALRNRAPLLDAIRAHLPSSGVLLETASGTGEHAVYLGRELPYLTIQPSDPDDEARRIIAEWIRESGVANVRAPLALDATEPEWPELRVDVLLNVNMVHISPWQACTGLLSHASRLLADGAPLIMYGPYRRRGVPTAASNEAFDESLRARNPAFGLRMLDDVIDEAARRGLVCTDVIEMPANNLTVIYRRRR